LAADWLKPIYEHIRTEMLSSGYLQVDETPIRYLAPGHGRTKLGYLWICHAPRGDVVFHWKTSRAAACLEEIVPSQWQGKIQSDGYRAYGAFVPTHNAQAGGEAITQAGCWAHARRAIFEGQPSAPQTVNWLLRQIAKLYDIERQLRENRAGGALRQATRAAHSG